MPFFSLYLNICGLQKGPGKFFMGSWKSPGFFVSKRVGTLDIAPLTILDRGALQPRKWQLTGNDCSTAAQAAAAQSPH